MTYTARRLIAQSDLGMDLDSHMNVVSSRIRAFDKASGLRQQRGVHLLIREPRRIVHLDTDRLETA